MSAIRVGAATEYVDDGRPNRARRPHSFNDRHGRPGTTVRQPRRSAPAAFCVAYESGSAARPRADTRCRHRRALRTADRGSVGARAPPTSAQPASGRSARARRDAALVASPATSRSATAAALPLKETTACARRPAPERTPPMPRRSRTRELRRAGWYRLGGWRSVRPAYIRRSVRRCASPAIFCASWCTEGSEGRSRGDRGLLQRARRACRLNLKQIYFLIRNGLTSLRHRHGGATIATMTKDDEQRQAIVRELLEGLSDLEIRQLCIDALRTWYRKHPTEGLFALHSGLGLCVAYNATPRL